MSDYTRDWLRTFLHLDARARHGVVPQRDVERQEDTVLRALALLEHQPGVVLADEVGMGKTYEALGLIAARRQILPGARTLILTPGPDLNRKWQKEIRALADSQGAIYRGLEGRHIAVRTLAELSSAFQQNELVVAPVSMFAGSRSLEDQAYLLTLWAQSRKLQGNQIAAIFNRYRDGQAARVDLAEARFLSALEWSQIERIAGPALEAHRARAPSSLDQLFDEQSYDAFTNRNAIDWALADLRCRLVGALLPALDLLVVDEAHKLKNAESARATAVSTIFEGRFDKAVFLTATPFQLGVDELRQMFALFALARTAPADLMSQADELLHDVRRYQDAYGDFERVWRQLDAQGASDFGAALASDPNLMLEPEDPTQRLLVRHARELLALKRERIEPGFRRWMIRSLRDDKRVYREPGRPRLRPKGGQGVPFLLYERFIAEMFRTKTQTHKAAVQINMVSSFTAAREGALLAEGRAELAPSAEGYRRLLRRVTKTLSDERGGHPKVAHVVDDAIDAASRDEKTLIFCARIETLKELKREIEHTWNDRILALWRRVVPNASANDIWDSVEDGTRVRGLHGRLQARFQRGQDALYLALRERYIETALQATSFARENAHEVARRANEILAKQRLPKAHAERTDWSVLKRCVERAVAELLPHDDSGDREPDAYRRMMDPQYVALGLDLVEDELESASVGSHIPTWTIAVDDVALVAPERQLWSMLKSAFVELPSELRVLTVERLARYLVSRYVPFLPQLLIYATSEGVDVENVEARVLLPIIDRFWNTPEGRSWVELLRRFLGYAAGLDELARRELMDDVLEAGAIVRHTAEGETREKLREAFNTPLYPMILVANEVMQEGLDLHHHCRRVVHHDLAWNPAQLEQRVGRVDRLGSRIHQLRLKRPDEKLHISMPLIANTIDERLERTVRLRERWLEFLLGAPPDFEEHGLADEPGIPLPEAFARALRIELGPTRTQS